ncbi:MAG: acyl--CoA ligase, partial [Pseudomonadota bacterium]|nr:acyl--CoA ligase [Pseudomonadota bacterium]
MPSELDRKFDAILSAVTGPNGRIQIGRDDQGRAIVTNLPPTLPLLFDVFCAVHADTIAVIANGERLKFSELNRQATRLAKALVGGWGIRKGDRVAIAMRNAPAWIVCYMAALKAGAIATLVNGWWQPDEVAHALELTESKLIIADAPRARRVAAAGVAAELVTLPIELTIEDALAPLLAKGSEDAELPAVAPEDDATILFTSGSTGAAKGAVSAHRAVTTGVYAYSIALLTMLGIKESEGNPPPNPPRTLVAVPLFHVTG